MKKFNSKDFFLIVLISITVCSTFLTPGTKAQTWTYNGADTTQIQDFSVYPSEWYIYNNSYETERYQVVTITHGNVSSLGLGTGNTAWSDVYWVNITSGELEFSNNLHGSWNSSIGYQGNGFIIPVGNDGKISQDIIDNVSSHLWSGLWEHNQTNINYYSITFWNTAANEYFLRYNYTEGGILTKLELYYSVPVQNYTLVSSPTQLPPNFQFSTADNILDVSTSNITLKVNITSADNNNDGEVDTDYLYRVLNGVTWSNWTIIPAFINYDLGTNSSGNYDIILEVKNMYGVTQKQISIQFTDPNPTVPEGTAPEIPSFSTLFIALIFLLSASIIAFRYQKRSKYPN